MHWQPCCINAFYIYFRSTRCSACCGDLADSETDVVPAMLRWSSAHLPSDDLRSDCQTCDATCAVKCVVKCNLQCLSDLLEDGTRGPLYLALPLVARWCLHKDVARCGLIAARQVSRANDHDMGGSAAAKTGRPLFAWAIYAGAAKQSTCAVRRIGLGLVGSN